MAAFQDKQVLQGAAANTYASGMTDRVGPTQKLQAQAQAQGKVTDVANKQTALAAEKGAYNTQYRDEQRTAEGKNVIARQALGLNVEKQTAAEAAARTRPERR